MVAFPRLTWEAALLDSPLAASPTWYPFLSSDGRSRLNTCNVNRALGRAGTSTSVLDNSDGDLNPWNTAGQYYGNLFDADDADFEGSIGQWTAVSNCSVTQSAAYAGHGTKSMEVTATAGGAFSFVSNGTTRLPVIAGKVYTPLLAIRALEHTATFTLTVRFFDALSGGSSVGTAVGGGPTVTPGAFTEQGGAPVTAPAGAVGADLLLTASATAAGDHFYVDTAQLAGGTSTTWGPGGRGGNLQPDTKIRLRADWNLLSANQASVETDTGGLLARTNCAISQSNRALVGAHSLKLTSSAAGDMSAQTTAVTGAVPLTTYSFMASFLAETVARNCQLTVLWINSVGGLVDTSTSSATADNTLGWAQVAFNATCPLGASQFSLVFSVIGTGGAAEIHHVDCNGIFPAPDITTWSAGGTYYVFTHHANRWATEWENIQSGDAAVIATDAFKALTLTKKPRTDYYDAVMADTPVGYFKLDETGLASVVNGLITTVDSSGNGYDGTYRGSVANFENNGALPAEVGTAVDFGVRAGWAEIPISTTPSGTTDFTIEMWVFPRSFDQNNLDRLWHVAGIGPQLLQLGIRSDGTVRLNATDGTNGGDIDSSVPLRLNRWNHLMVTKSGAAGPGTGGAGNGNWKVYLDKVDVSTNAITSGTGNCSLTSNWAVLAATELAGVSSGAFDGLLDEVAIYFSALSSVTAHYDAGFGLVEQVLTGVRVGQILDFVGVPAGDQDLDAGQFEVQPVDEPIYDTPPLALIATGNGSMVECEGWPAAFFISAEGKHVFQDRAHATAASAGTFSDDSSTLNYDPGPGPERNDDNLWTQVVLQADNGEPKTAGQSAADRFFDRTLTRTGLKNADDADVQTMADDLYDRYSTARDTITTLTIHPSDEPGTLWPQVLGRELNDVITVTRTDLPGDGAPFSGDFRIVGIQHNIQAQDWHTTWTLEAA